MFCTSCGKQIADNSKFCPHCGNVIAEAEAPVEGVLSEPAAEPEFDPVDSGFDSTPASPVNDLLEKAKSAAGSLMDSGKGINKMAIVLGAIAAVVVVALIIVLCVVNTPTAKLTRALSKTASAYTDLAEDLKLTGFASALEDQSYSDSLALELVDVNSNIAGEIPTGIGVRYQGAYNLPKKDISMVLTPYYGSADLLTLEAAIQDDCIYVAAPDILGEGYYAVNTTTLGADLVELADLDSDYETLGFNLFELVELATELTTPSKDATKELEAAGKDLLKAISVEKGKSSTEDINDHNVKCTRYDVVIPEDALSDFIHAIEKYSESVDTEAAVEEILNAIGMPEEMIEMAMDEVDLSSVSDVFSSLDDVIEEIGDVELQVYVSGGYISAVVYELDMDGMEAEVGLYLGGDDVYVNDLSLRIEADGMEIVLASTGNHNGKGGTYTDETTLEMYGMTAFSSECSYSPREKSNNFEWTVEANGVKLEVLGQLELKSNSLHAAFEEVNVRASGTKVLTLAVDYAIDDYARLVKPKNPVMVLEMSEDEITDLVADIQENAMDWAMDLMDEIPELEYMF